jgi:transposase-like protein
MTNLSDPIYHDDAKAREYLESLRWAGGRFCPHCGEAERTSPIEGESNRPGMYYCRACEKQFTVTIGTVYERSHIPLHKWVTAMHLMASSKKGISAHQLHRLLGITYKSAWFMAHRIREAMREAKPGPLGGQNKVVEVDETYVGGKLGNRKSRKVPPKKAVVALVEREGRVRGHHVPTVNAKTLRPILVSQVSRKSYLMTDESKVYPSIGKEFAGHGTVNHSAEEYVRTGGFHHTNTVENFFSILKRGITGVYQHTSEKHLSRYVDEFAFRHNNRIGLGVTDDQRREAAIKGAEGKRLTYRRTDKTTNA